MELKDALEYLMNYFDADTGIYNDFSDAYYLLLALNTTGMSNNDSSECIDYSNLVEDFWCDKQGFNHCGCGSPSDCYKPIYDLLDCYMHDKTISFDDRDRYEQKCNYMESKLGIKTVYDSPFTLYLAYEFDRIGLTEHGGSIGGAWITDLGKAIYTLFDYYFKDEENGSISN